MNKLTVGVTVGVLVVGGFVFASKYNSLIESDQHVQYTYAQVQNVLSRQYQLVKGLSQVADRYAQHENDTFKGVAVARGPKPPAALSADPKNLANSTELQKQLADSQNALQNYNIQINAAVEAYPQLKADKQFSELSKEMEGSINRVTVERRRNQMAVQDFNSNILHFPGYIVAKLVGYHTYPYYTAPSDQQQMPDLFQK